jgi:Protein of unknown function (DUF3638)
MVAPTGSSNQNTVHQLNMGEGKSSVIVPMISTALADGRIFVRVVVLKSLSSQMFRLLVDRLSGLLNREDLSLALLPVCETRRPTSRACPESV